MNRRRFLRQLSTSGMAGSLGLRAVGVDAEPRLETTKLRLVKIPSICQAPQYVADELLRAEGFTDVQYVPKPGAVGITEALASGEANINNHFVAPSLIRVEAGDPIVILGGLHIGCFEVFAGERVRTVRELRGKTVAVLELGSSQHVFLSTIIAHIGLDPRRDVNWVTAPAAESMRLLAEGKVDAFLGFPPEPQELRAKKVGHVIVNSTFVRKHPVATKQALRAILKANTICALEPERAARHLVDKGFTPRFDYALQALKDIPYAAWRSYDPADTIRFYALRLHEAGMIKSSPQKILAQGTDWRFLDELKKELKA